MTEPVGTIKVAELRLNINYRNLTLDIVSPIRVLLRFDPAHNEAVKSMFATAGEIPEGYVKEFGQGSFNSYAKAVLLNDSHPQGDGAAVAERAIIVESSNATALTEVFTMFKAAGFKIDGEKPALLDAQKIESLMKELLAVGAKKGAAIS